jgi:hypothetical protein
LIRVDVLRSAGKCDNENGSAGEAICGMDLAAMGLHDALTNWQSQTDATLAVGDDFFSAIEFIEDLDFTAWEQTWAIVGDANLDCVARGPSVNFDA